MTTVLNQQLGFKAILHTDFDSVLNQLTQALKEEGFGVLTEIDVQSTMRNQIGELYPQFRIIGACNPLLVHQALSSFPDVGLLLPCNITAVEIGEGKVEISIIDPLLMMEIAQEPGLQPVAEEARARLRRVSLSLKENH